MPHGPEPGHSQDHVAASPVAAPGPCLGRNPLWPAPNGGPDAHLVSCTGALIGSDRPGPRAVSTAQRGLLFPIWTPHWMSPGPLPLPLSCCTLGPHSLSPQRGFSLTSALRASCSDGPSLATFGTALSPRQQQCRVPAPAGTPNGPHPTVARRSPLLQCRGAGRAGPLWFKAPATPGCRSCTRPSLGCFRTPVPPCRKRGFRSAKFQQSGRAGDRIVANYDGP
ncbi:hypothetical protein NDU88_006852 [Pleurodeles waltl]|uniref:Uncharacterized protein n=1 Tax=Pleurodeles waltl TaxID=8319 RepID=A0AAV7UM91_PLEWA|nr:hypothetical protein NDU88_006852 [Pleurodeles waltl]